MVSIQINGDPDALFVTENEVLSSFEEFCSEAEANGEKLDLKKIEDHINGIPSVHSSDIYKSVNGSVNIEVNLKTVLGRIVPSSGEPYYLDSKGIMMPIVDRKPSRVCVVNGFIHEAYNEVPYYLGNDSLAKASLIDDIYRILSFTDKDPFWKAQIEQIYVTKDKKFILIPKVGEHEIMFGDGNNIKGKFKKLELFYQKGINRVGWDKYKTIDIQYKGQVIGIGPENPIIVPDSLNNNNGQTQHI